MTPKMTLKRSKVYKKECFLAASKAMLNTSRKKKRRAFPPLEECFLLRMLYDFGGKTEYVSKKNYDNVQHFSHWRLCASPLRLRRQKKRHGGGKALCAIRYFFLKISLNHVNTR